MKKIFVLFLMVFMFFGGAVLAQETTTTILEKSVSMPFSFNIAKLFLEFRKMVTFNPVDKAEIENTILEKEEGVINKMLENDKMSVDNKVVSRFMARREKALNNLENLKNKGENVSDLIQRIENNTIDQDSVLYKRLDGATDDQKEKIVDNLIKKQEITQNRIQIKEAILEDKNTEENIKNPEKGIVLQSEEQNSLLNNLVDTVKDKVILLNQNQKNHFINYLKLKIFKLKDEGIDVLKEKIEDGSIKLELYSIMDKIINYNRPVVSIENQEQVKEKIQEKIQNQEKIQEMNQERNGFLEGVKNMFLELKGKKELNEEKEINEVSDNSNQNMNQLNNGGVNLEPMQPMMQQKGLNNKLENNN
jgi:hypothetical protein